MQDSVIDWELATRLAGNSQKMAKEMFFLLVKELPADVVALKKEYGIYDMKALKIRLHKLHGALCYCGAPRLKRVVAKVELAITQKKIAQIPSLITELECEVNELIKQISCLSS